MKAFLFNVFIINVRGKNLHLHWQINLHFKFNTYKKITFIITHFTFNILI